ncbi:hypothetical protein [Janibacter anophelis]|uniref:hypothetical protein n=1 Tax=Janibacter anophelis TaxID=319054 RepID=UPI0013B067A5|nr:hypothetical protein [Janibacter anophelis]
MGLDLDHRISILITQLGWSLPTTIAVLVIAGIAVMRRDEGLWWKLVVAGAACLVLATVVQVLGTFVVYGFDQGYRLTWLAGVPALVLDVVGIALIGAGAITGRRREATR